MAWSDTLQNFDLKCTGPSYVQTVSDGKKIKGNVNSQTVLHVDLDQKAFCENECRYVFNVDWFSENEISLKNKKDKGRSEIFHVDRISGSATQSINDGDTVVLTFYQCEPVPFTGLDMREDPKF